MTPGVLDVRVWETVKVPGARGIRYRVRWATDGRARSRTFATAKMADTFRASLVSASRAGSTFDEETGLPLTKVAAAASGPSWFEHAQAFVDMKWPDSSPRHRQSTAEGLATITTALLPRVDEPDPALVRKALRAWAFNSAARAAEHEPPADLAGAVRWVAGASAPLSLLGEPSTLRAVLSAIGTNLDGSPASPSTTNRKRAALSGALGYAVELGHLPTNPLPRVKASRRRDVESVDPRVVVSPTQARALLAAIRERFPALHGYFACLYFAALRPAEAANLRERDLWLPPAGWGEIVLSGSYQPTRREWTNDGRRGEERPLKHRPRAAVRRVPAAPELVEALREHLAGFEVGAEGRLFVTRTGKIGRPVAQPFVRPVSSSMTTRALGIARPMAFTPAEAASPLARRPYDLRHACLSTWLAAGVDPSQVALWAGHSVAVLLRVYAHAVGGREELAKQRIGQALGETQTPLSHRSP